MQATATIKYNQLSNSFGGTFMTQKITVAKKWGNSIGVVLPAEMVRDEGIRPNDRVVVTVKRVVPLKELFGTLKTNKSTEEIMKEIREGWD